MSLVHATRATPAMPTTRATQLLQKVFRGDRCRRTQAAEVRTERTESAASDQTSATPGFCCGCSQSAGQFAGPQPRPPTPPTLNCVRDCTIPTASEGDPPTRHQAQRESPSRRRPPRARWRSDGPRPQSYRRWTGHTSHQLPLSGERVVDA